MQPEFDTPINEKCAARMAKIDSMPAEIRELIYEHGYNIIHAFLDAGITKPSAINNIIDHVRMGPSEAWKVHKGSLFYRSQTGSERLINNFLNALNFPPIAKQIFGYLLRKSRIIAPLYPTEKMIEASMNAVIPPHMGGRLLDKKTKHKLRLRAALEVAAHEQMIGDE